MGKLCHFSFRRYGQQNNPCLCERTLWQISIFSFQSKDTEITDSEAAHAICEKLGLKHNVYPIPTENSEIEDFDELKAIIIHSYGYVRGLADNEIRKHICMYRWHYFDTEIKSWISEIVRVFLRENTVWNFLTGLRRGISVSFRQDILLRRLCLENLTKSTANTWKIWLGRAKIQLWAHWLVLLGSKNEQLGYDGNSKFGSLPQNNISL